MFGVRHCRHSFVLNIMPTIAGIRGWGAVARDVPSLVGLAATQLSFDAESYHNMDFKHCANVVTSWRQHRENKLYCIFIFGALTQTRLKQ